MDPIAGESAAAVKSVSPGNPVAKEVKIALFPGIFEIASGFWKAEFRRQSSLFSELPKKERNSKLNQLFKKLDKSEKQEWYDYATDIRTSKKRKKTKPKKPKFQLKSVEDYMESDVEKAQYLSSSPASSSSPTVQAQEPINRMNSGSGDSTEDEELPQLVTCDTSNRRVEELMHHTGLCKIDRKARTLWRTEFRQHSSEYSHLNARNRKSVLNHKFEELEQSVRQEWREYAQAIERDPQANKPNFEMKSRDDDVKCFKVELKHQQELSNTQESWSTLHPPAFNMSSYSDDITGEAGPVVEVGNTASVGSRCARLLNGTRTVSTSTTSLFLAEDEPLNQNKAKVVSHKTFKTARKLWRGEFRNYSNLFSELGKKRNSKLNELFEEVHPAEKQEWISYVEAKRNFEVHGGNSPPRKPNFVLKSNDLQGQWRATCSETKVHPGKFCEMRTTATSTDVFVPTNEPLMSKLKKQIKLERAARKYWSLEFRRQPGFGELPKEHQKQPKLIEIFGALKPVVKQEWMTYAEAFQKYLNEGALLPKKPKFDLTLVALQTEDRFLPRFLAQKGSSRSNWRSADSPSPLPLEVSTEDNETGPSVVDLELRSDQRMNSTMDSSSRSSEFQEINGKVSETQVVSNSSSLRKNEPLRNKIENMVNIEAKARVYWRSEFRLNSSALSGLTKGQRKSELNRLFEGLSELEKQKWRDYAEKKLSNLHQDVPAPSQPGLNLKSRNTTEEDEEEEEPRKINCRSESDNNVHSSVSKSQTPKRDASDPSCDNEANSHAHQTDMKPDQREKITMDSSSEASDPDCADNIRNAKVAAYKKLPPANSNANTNREHFTTKNGKEIIVENRAQTYFRKELSKKIRAAGPCFPDLTKRQRRSKMNSMWGDLDESQQQEWIEYTKTKLRNNQDGVNSAIDPPAIPQSMTPQQFPSSRKRRELKQRKKTGKVRVDFASILKDIPKPQEKFEFRVDNSRGPFVPILKWKPRVIEESRLVPYVPRKELEEDGTEAENYEHPYEIEILVWTPNDSQLATETVSIIPDVLVPEPFDLVDTEEGVNEMLDHLAACDEIAVDLEHHSVRSFMGLTCLIQISSRTRDFIVDGLAMHRKLDWLNQVFTNPRIIKVFHGAQSDIQWLQRDFGLYVVGMFDTCIAGEHLYGKQLSLKYLLETYVDQVDEVDKTHQIADWRVRPLPIDMLHYARMDTHYLLPLYDILKKKLKESGDEKLKQAFLDSSARCLTLYKKPDGKPNLKQKELIASFNKRQRQAYESLFRWRDSIGRCEDESPENYILSNAGLERLARILPADETHLTEILETNCNALISPLVIKHMETVLSIIAVARNIPLNQAEDEDKGCDEEETKNSEYSDDDEIEVASVSSVETVLSTNFRKMPVIPSIDELFAEEDNPLEKNLTVGSYQSSNHYLGTHFKLLREDFIRSIKPGLKAVKDGRPIGTRNGIRVHTNIELISMEKKKWKIRLPDRLKNKVHHENTKRFLPGSLLIFTNNNFVDIFLGLISHSHSKKAMEEEDMGIFSLTLRGNNPKPNWEPGSEFVTIECHAFFEPYRCVMTSLKQNSWLNNVSISKYLLNPNFDGIIRPPKYLRGAKSFNVASEPVNWKELSEWPSADEIGLDEAQFKAYQAALTQEFAVIQGPPGTGKTYLGLRILETLMEEENMALWRGKKGGPIIIVCFTNHALDQFGEGILDLFTPPEEHGSQTPYQVTSPRIVRLGAGCQSPRLKDYVPDTGGSSVRRDNVDILLMTTTGAAMRHHKLMGLNSKIMIVEEAAEVFESHILGCFTPSLEHLILLGDHQQLRPITATRELSATYDLDVSLFERMVALNKFPKNQLQVQHRMRPSIRDLITGPHMYPILMDHESVVQYPAKVVGMERPLFFIDHRVQEAQKVNDETSQSNHYEVEYLGYLCTYLLRAGHSPSSITVLGMYSSQVKHLEREIRYRRGVPASLRIETLDSFQGEENEIIMLSLVRSNMHKDIGFMREDNRICVAMSRARQGFYMIGNMELLASVSPTWRTIRRKLAENGNIGPVLSLTCDKHVPKTITQIRTPRDFQNALRTPCAECTRSQKPTAVNQKPGLTKKSKKVK